jgi:hypothetical protein
MSSPTRRLAKKLMLKKGFQPMYRIKNGAIVKDRFPLLMEKKNG